MDLKGFLDTFHPTQRAALLSILAPSAPKYHVLVCGRTWGKDYLLNAVAPILIEAGKRVYWYANSHDEAHKTFKLIASQLTQDQVYLHKSSPRVITHKPSGGSVTFYSYGHPEGIRGKNFADWVIVNEAALITDDVFNTIIEATLRAAKERVVLASTPRASGTWFHKYTLDTTGAVRTYHYPTALNPYVSAEELERIRLRVPASVFKQEYLAEFIEGSGSVFAGCDRYVVEPTTPTPPYFGGIDVGLKNDKTVYTIIDSTGYVVEQVSLSCEHAEDLVGKLVAVFQRYNNPYTAVEQNGLGLPISQALTRKSTRFIPYTTTAESKDRMVNDAFYALELGVLRIDSKLIELVKEMGLFVVKPSSTGIYRYEAASGHDDRVMSLLYAWKQFDANLKRKLIARKELENVINAK